MKGYLSFLLLATNLFSVAQERPQVNIKENKGDIVNKKIIDNRTINYYNTKGKDSILNVSKYIDTTKDIIIRAGSNIIGPVSLKKLKSQEGYQPFVKGNGGINIKGGEKIITLKIVKARLLISSEIDGFDEKFIARVIDNLLIPAKKDYHLYISDKSFELFDEYFIPVLQIKLSKENNEIYIGGVFNHERGYTIITNTKLITKQFESPKLQISLNKRDSLEYQFRSLARLVKPIHTNFPRPTSPPNSSTLHAVVGVLQSNSLFLKLLPPLSIVLNK